MIHPSARDCNLKGEPILVEPGMKFLMETATLQLEAHVVDMVYARGPLPENSYFSRLTLKYRSGKNNQIKIKIARIFSGFISF